MSEEQIKTIQSKEIQEINFNWQFRYKTDDEWDSFTCNQCMTIELAYQKYKVDPQDNFMNIPNVMIEFDVMQDYHD